MKTQQTEWQNIGKSNSGYFLWKSADETGKPIYKYERTQPKATEGGYYNAESAAKLKNLTPNKAQHSPLPWQTDFAIEAVFDDGTRNETVIEIMTGDHGDTPCYATSKANAHLIVRAVNNADKLAEALRKIKAATHPTSTYHQWADNALAAYEAAR